MKSITEIAKAAYEVHGRTMGLKNIRPYESLTGLEQAAWIAVVQALRDEIGGVL